MQITDFSPHNRIKIPPFWLAIISAGLIAIHLTLVFKADRPAYLAISITFWAAAVSVFWDKRKRLSFESGFISGCLGLLLVVGLVLVSGLHSGTRFLAALPFLSGLAIALLTSGVARLKEHRQELTLLFFLFFLGMPDFVRSQLPDITRVTAKFSTFLLWYLGLPVVLEDTHISLPNGGVEVVPACSGMLLISYMVGMAVIFLMLFPLTSVQKVIVPLAGISLGFVMNGIRVALLAFLSSRPNPQLFDYWHSDGGGLIFVSISIVLFGVSCLLLLRPSHS